MARNRTKKPLGLSFETLERREVFAGLTGGLSNGVLTINGTTAADNISLTQTADVVRLDGYNAAWSAGAVKQIRINTGAGDDTVRLAVSKQLASTFVGDGGTGRDTIYTTAVPASVTGFEVGQLIAPPPVAQPVSTPAITVVKQAAPNVMPGQYVVYDRWTYDWGLRDDSGYTMGPSRVYSTEAEARAAAQQHIDSTKGNGYWAVTHVRITGEASIKGTASQGGTSSTYATAFANVFRDIANRYNQFSAVRNQIVNQMNNLVTQYRPYYNVYQNAIRVRDGINQVLNNMNMSMQDVYNRYSQQSKYVWANPSVLTIIAQQLRREADAAKSYMNQNLSGDIYTPVRNAGNSALQIVYDAAKTLENFAGNIRRSQSVL